MHDRTYQKRTRAEGVTLHYLEICNAETITAGRNDKVRRTMNTKRCIYGACQRKRVTPTQDLLSLMRLLHIRRLGFIHRCVWNNTSMHISACLFNNPSGLEFRLRVIFTLSASYEQFRKTSFKGLTQFGFYTTYVR